MPSPAPLDLETFGEWGGRAWLDQLRRGLDWLGDVRELRVLELGTRHGRMATWFALHGATVTAVDIDRQPLTEARQFAHRHGVDDRVRFETYDGDPARLAGGFDVVFAKSVLVLMDLAATVDALAKLLLDDGRLLIVENARGPIPVHVARMVRRRSLRPHGARYFTPASAATLRRWFDLELEHWTSVPPTVVIGARRRPV